MDVEGRLSAPTEDLARQGREAYEAEIVSLIEQFNDELGGSFVRGGPHHYFSVAGQRACAIERDDGEGSAPCQHDDHSQALSQATRCFPVSKS
jgi:hypothetical protein